MPGGAKKANTSVDLACNACNQTSGASGDVKVCVKCAKGFHAKCKGMQAVCLNGKYGLVCTDCKSSVKPQRTTRNSAKAAATLTPRTPRTLSQCSSSSKGSTDDALRVVLEKLKTLDSIDKRQIQMAEKQEALIGTTTSIENRLKPIEDKLELLSGIPERVSQVETDVLDLKERLAKLEATAGAGGASTSGIGSGGKADAQIRAISRRVTDVEKKKEAMRRQIIVSGLHTDDKTDLRQLVHAVISSLDPTVPLREIVSAVRMLPRGGRTAAVNPSDDKDTVDAGAGADGLTAATDSDVNSDDDDTDDTANVNALSRQPNILVKLSSSALVRSTISAKIAKGKLSSKVIGEDVLVAARAPSPYEHSFININEYLPLNLHKLRMAALHAAKDNGLSCYVRNGTIYIKAPGDQRAAIIRSEKNLNDFLAKNTSQ